MSAARIKPTMVKFGYGIVDADGKPYWDEMCVAEDRQVLESEVLPSLNERDPLRTHRAPYRVVTLYRRASSDAASIEGRAEEP